MFRLTFFVLGNLNPGSKGPTAAATNKQADDRGVSGEEWAEFEFESMSCVGDLLFSLRGVSPFAIDRSIPEPFSGVLHSENSQK